MTRHGYVKHCPAITTPRTPQEYDACITALYNNKEFIASIDKTMELAGMKIAEKILLKAMDECKQKILSPAHDIWLPIERNK